MEKYYYEFDEKCKFVEQDSEISSPNCMECEFFYGVDFMECWIKCEIYSAFEENKNLREENSLLKDELNLLKGGL